MRKLVWFLLAAGSLMGQGIPVIGSMAPSNASGGPGAPVYINSICGPTASGGSGGTSASVNMTGANFFALFVTHNSTADVLTVSDSQSDSPTALTQSGSSQPTINIYYFQNVTGVSGETFSVTGSSSYPGFCVLGFSGMATSGVYETGTQSTANAASPGSSTSTYTGYNIFLTGSGAGTNFSAAAINSGYQTPIAITNAADIYPSAISYRIQSGIGSQNPSWTLTGSTGQWSTQAVFKGAN